MTTRPAPPEVMRTLSGILADLERHFAAQRLAQWDAKTGELYDLCCPYCGQQMLFLVIPAQAIHCFACEWEVCVTADDLDSLIFTLDGVTEGFDIALFLQALADGGAGDQPMQ